jgi:tRNA pseudouridine38-40 synthase
MRIALGLEYCGAGFHGWQSQPQGNTVQDVLEVALAQIAGESLGVICAGRTDAGVHATQQVVHFDTCIERPLSAWVRGVNSHLPSGVAVRWAQLVSDDFHARFSARGRRYRYLLVNRAQRPGLWQGRVGWFHLPLDIELMQSAAQRLVGEHDFSAFRAANCQAKTPVKNLSRAEISIRGNLIVFDFEASAFLHHMVRNLVGTLVYIGKGRKSQAGSTNCCWPGIASRRLLPFRRMGLYFRGPVYEPHWNLPVPNDDFLDGVLL